MTAADKFERIAPKAHFLTGDCAKISRILARDRRLSRTLTNRPELDATNAVVRPHI